MATAKKDSNKMVEAAILRDCGFGLGGDLVTLTEADAAIGVQHGMLDAHPDAVKALKVVKAKE